MIYAMSGDLNWGGCLKESGSQKLIFLRENSNRCILVKLMKILPYG